jgi:hypothetical protein
LIREGIEFATLNVVLELAIPGRPVKRQKPVAKLRKLVGGQSLDLVLNSFDFAHDTSLALASNRRLASARPSCQRALVSFKRLLN